jgi:type IV pilus assembly protein PilW
MLYCEQQIMTRRPINQRINHSQLGLSMIELMVAITIGLILSAGIIQIFANSKQTYRIEESLSRVQESGRMALDFISNDVRMASYWGCQPDPSNIQNDLAAGAGYIDFTSGAVTGTEGGAGAPDSLTLSGADGTLGLVLQPNGGGGSYSTATSTALQVSTPNDLSAGDIVLVGDCTGGDIFQVTGANPSAAGVVDHAVGGGSPGNASQLSKAYQGDASIYYVHQTIYTIKAGADGQPALWRSVDGADQEIVEDVSDLQVLYGEDMNNDRSVDRYVDANNVSNFANVYSVRVRLTVQTAAASTSVIAGNRITRNFSTTVAVRNRVL